MLEWLSDKEIPVSIDFCSRQANSSPLDLARRRPSARASVQVTRILRKYFV